MFLNKVAVGWPVTMTFITKMEFINHRHAAENLLLCALGKILFIPYILKASYPVSSVNFDLSPNNKLIILYKQKYWQTLYLAVCSEMLAGF